MEKADIQKSLIIFNCFVLSWSDVRVTQLVRGSVFQVKSPFSLNEGHGYTACWWTQACPCSMLPDVKHLENGLVLKREQLWRAISWLFQQSKIKPKRKKKKQTWKTQKSSRQGDHTPSWPGRLGFSGSVLGQLHAPFTLKSDNVQNTLRGRPDADGKMKMSGTKRCSPAPHGPHAFLRVAHPETVGCLRLRALALLHAGFNMHLLYFTILYDYVDFFKREKNKFFGKKFFTWIYESVYNHHKNKRMSHCRFPVHEVKPAMKLMGCS